MSYGGSWAGFAGAHSAAQDNTVRTWWQSRHRLARPPQLTDLRALAAAIQAGPANGWFRDTMRRSGERALTLLSQYKDRL